MKECVGISSKAKTKLGEWSKNLGLGCLESMDTTDVRKGKVPL